MDQYKEGAWQFRRPAPEDLYPISEWMAEAAGKSERWRRGTYKQLLREFERTEKMLRPTPSWMVTFKHRRMCFLELAGEEILLIAPPQLLRKSYTALVVWRRVVKYLVSRYPGMTFRVYLDPSRQTEMQVLERLGFKLEAGYYIL